MFKPGGWLAPGGSKTPGQAALEQMGGGAAGGSGDGKDKKDDKGKKDEEKYSGSGFDPRGLERAAKAAQVCFFCLCCVPPQSLPVPSVDDGMCVRLCAACSGQGLLQPALGCALLVSMMRFFGRTSRQLRVLKFPRQSWLMLGSDIFVCL